MAPDRRSVLASAAAAGSAALAGCSDVAILGGGPSARFEYHVSHSIPHQEMPEEVLTSEYPADYEWAVIDVRLTEGTLDTTAFFRHTHFQYGQHGEAPLVAVRVYGSEETWIMSEDDSFELTAPADLELYYRYDEDYFSPFRFRKGDLENEGVAFVQNEDLEIGDN